eukprot:gb/GECH01012460.1/.p1 GENE.gb/GECH01012460.1/~~gb/GECH01012460.1/.p1  ORF type:complete len:319 (+),score=91.13 gb/GECH01012460.1/:1-957(+)
MSGHNTNPSDEEQQALAKWKCPDCESPNIVEDHAAGDLVCTNCGRVVGDRVIDIGKEWRSFEGDADKSRVGGPSNPIFDTKKELTTVISGGDANKQGGPQSRNTFSKIHNRSAMSSERSLQTAFDDINRMAERFELPQKIKDRACRVFQQMDEKKAMRGRNTDAMTAACLYSACRLEGVPRTLKEICALTKATKKDIGRAYKQLLKVLDSEMNVKTINSGDYMSRFCSHLDLPQIFQSAAQEVAKKASEVGLVAGKSPVTISAAAIMYVVQFSSKYHKSQKEISDMTGVSEPTIRNCYRDMSRREDLLSDDLKAKVSN